MPSIEELDKSSRVSCLTTSHRAAKLIKDKFIPKAIINLTIRKEVQLDSISQLHQESRKQLGLDSMLTMIVIKSKIKINEEFNKTRENTHEQVNETKLQTCELQYS